MVSKFITQYTTIQKVPFDETVTGESNANSVGVKYWFESFLKELLSISILRR